MDHFTTKQKIIGGAIVGILVIVIGIYGYSMLEQEENWEDNTLIAEEGLQNEVARQEGDNPLNEITTNQENKESANSGEVAEEQTNGYANLEGKIVIHITGAVQKTGILILPEGARIADAIDASGGSTENADLNEVNLAYELQDGQKVYIPTKEDKSKVEKQAYISSESGNNVIMQTISNDKKGGISKVNINTATQEELESLPGIGAAIANRIMEYRQQNGKFQKIEDLQNVKGIGDAKFSKMKKYVIVK